MKKTKKAKPKLDPAPKRINDAYYWLRQDMTDDDKPPYYGLKRSAISPYTSSTRDLTTQDPAL